MVLWFWLFFLGWVTYLLLRRSPASKGRTPIWVLWLVLMLPALVWAIWTLIFGETVAPPLWLMLGPFLICPFIYWLLVRRGLATSRKSSTAENSNPAPLSSTAERKLNKLMAQAEGTTPSSTALPRPLNKDEEAELKQCFPWTLFALHQVEYRLQAVICQGQLRGDPAEAYACIQTNINDRFGERFLVLLQETWSGKPFFALVPNASFAGAEPIDQLVQAPAREKTVDSSPHSSRQSSLPLSTAEDSEGVSPSSPSDRLDRFYRPGIALGLLLVTLFTTTFVGTIFSGVPLESLSDLGDEAEILLRGVPYSLSLILILGCHEFGHFWAARHYHIATTLPYFIPIPTFLGTFGAFIQIKDPIPHRRALFDLSFAGPALGLVVAIPCLWWGLAHSQLVDPTAETNLMNFESLNPWGSMLLALISRLALGSRLGQEIALDLHPVAIAGYLGVIVTALNLMPVGQLDGGHIVHAMFGQRTGAVIGQTARLFMLLLSLRQPELLLWSLLLLFIPVVDEPALNDVSELDDGRDLLGFVALGLLLLILLPVPSFLQNILV